MSNKFILILAAMALVTLAYSPMPAEAKCRTCVSVNVDAYSRPPPCYAIRPGPYPVSPAWVSNGPYPYYERYVAAPYYYNPYYVDYYCPPPRVSCGVGFSWRCR